MDWINSPPFFIFAALYAVVFYFLLAAYLNQGERRSEPSTSDSTAPRTGRAVESSSTGLDSGAAEVLEEFEPRNPVRPSKEGVAAEPPRKQFLDEAEKLFSSEKQPVLVMDENMVVFYRNRAARRLFGSFGEGQSEPLNSILGVEYRSLEKQVSKTESGQVMTVECRLPNGATGTAQINFAVMNRVPRINALRITGLEEQRSSWLSRGSSPRESTSLTRGGHLDFREVDPASVELSADQMLGPLREVDELLQKVNSVSEDNGIEEKDASLQSARNKLRKTIRHIEEIDWMLQVTDGHLHLKQDQFRGYEVIASLAVAANRLSGDNGVRLRLFPEEPPPIEPLLSGDRRIFEKILTQLLTSAFRAADGEGVKVDYRFEALESPAQSDDWYLFAGEGETQSLATLLTVKIGFKRPDQETTGSDLPAVVETLGSQIVDPSLSRRLDFVRKGRDSDLFGLTLARELVGKLDGELAFQSGAEGESEFLIKLRFDNTSL
ncbi:MAG: hypothetical protein AAGJ81_12480 [Verrucomicrobiota bacterium]